MMLPQRGQIKVCFDACARYTLDLPGPKGSTRELNSVAISHVDKDNKPTMVDVSGKTPTARQATAECRVEFPPNVYATLHSQGLRAKKGPITDTAIIAGVMAAKRTHELIPFCHPLPLDGVSIKITEDPDSSTLVVTATCKVVHKTGVEMEAMTAASVAALTIYDMCKALSHDIVIRETRLIQKRGGKSDINPS
ncbi:MAG: cyclic pyranopterin monophosphate synthase MoaC [Gammaproteobacteria bacterium]